jgi:ribonuclease T1
VKRFATLFAAATLFAIAAFTSAGSPAKEITLPELPVEARQTLELIRKGGSFPYRQDGAVFGNREKHLPQQARGYYREYTVKTPGSRDRGARRIVAGAGKTGDVRSSGEYWYTDDHYNSFRRIVERRGN